MKAEEKSSTSKSMLYLGLFIILVLLGSAAYYFNEQSKEEAPQAKQVWSEEHQHYHTE